MIKRNSLLIKDKKRDGALPPYQVWIRRLQNTPPRILTYFYRLILRWALFRYKSEISWRCQIGEGLYIGHPYGITINEKAIIGRNCNIHKGVTIGQENRGAREGTPIIGNEVWIGVNATIVGKITIGDDVLIAPNCYVNRDIPSHSIVFGNPCVIKHKMNATEDYINNKVD